MIEVDKVVQQEADLRAYLKAIESSHAVYTFKIDESQRQVMLMALAHLAVERPGWDFMLNELALEMDRNVQGRAFLFEVFKGLREGKVVPEIADKAFILNSTTLTTLLQGKCSPKVGRRDL